MTATLSQATERLSLGVVILAAGLSKRMGRPKLLLPWRGTSVLGHLLRIWVGLDAAQITVVCAANAAEIHAELDRLHFATFDRILNPSPEAGMFSSIQCAARWPNWQSVLTHVAIVLGDQPHLRQSSLGQLLEFAARNPNKICQPLRGARRRHPVVLPRELFLAVNTTASDNLRDFLNFQSQRLAGIEINDSGLDMDLDSPADYERVKVLSQTD